jgi:hypothetical protein
MDENKVVSGICNLEKHVQIPFGKSNQGKIRLAGLIAW